MKKDGMDIKQIAEKLNVKREDIQSGNDEISEVY